MPWNEKTPVDDVRCNLKGADQARAKAEEYSNLADVLRDTSDRVGATITKSGWVRAVKRWLVREGDRIATIQLTDAQMDLLHRFFYESAQAEERRALGYEQQAIRAAGGEPTPTLRPWMPKDQINPGRINVSVSDFVEDPLETIARESAVHD